VRPEIWPDTMLSSKALSLGEAGIGCCRKPNRSAGVISWTSLLRQEFCAWLRDGCGQRFSLGGCHDQVKQRATVSIWGWLGAGRVSWGVRSMSLPSFSSGPTAPAEPPWRRTCRRRSAPTRLSAAGSRLLPESPEPAAHREGSAGTVQAAYVITAGPTGGVMMHLADQATAQELGSRAAERQELQSAAGPVSRRAGREIVSFDGRILVSGSSTRTRQFRTATWSNVRCAPRA